MIRLRLLKIFLSLSLLVNCWFWFKRPTEVVYEADKRVLEENEKKAKEIQALQLERDSLKAARAPIKERIIYRTIELKKDEKIINDAAMPELDSIIRTGF